MLILLGSLYVMSFFFCSFQDFLFVFEHFEYDVSGCVLISLHLSYLELIELLGW